MAVGADEADAADVPGLAALSGADAAGPGADAARGTIRMPRSSMVMSTPSVFEPGTGFSILTTGSRGGLGGLGARGACPGASITSLMRQLNGGMDSRMPAVIISSSASRKKRFQLMPTSQVA